MSSICGYVAVHQKQGVVGFVLKMAEGVLLHVRHMSDTSDKRIEYTEFIDGDLEEAADQLENISLSYSDFNVFPIGQPQVPLTADEDETFVQVLDYLADEPEHWLPELKVMSGMYNRITENAPYKVRQEDNGPPSNNGNLFPDDDFHPGLEAL